MILAGLEDDQICARGKVVSLQGERIISGGLECVDEFGLQLAVEFVKAEGNIGEQNTHIANISVQNAKASLCLA